MKIRAFLLALTAVAFVVACKKADKKPDDTTATQPADGTEAQGTPPEIVEKPITIDASGSDGGKIPGLYTINFEYDQARLTADAKQKLSENAEWIKKNPSTTVQIEGHTDSRGTVEYNLALGERRAKSVKTYLQGLGVDAKRMTIISYGEEKPLDATDSESSWGKNRRANFVPLNQ